MIIGIGLDLVEIKRIDQIWSRFDYKFARKILTQAELESLPPNAVNFLAGRFAAKEAAVKALGTGFSQGISFKDLQILTEESGKPVLFFDGQALYRANALQVKTVHLSLTHNRESAAAMVILEK